MIRVITEPTIRLVGRQAIDEEALAAFLADEGAEGWQSDTEVGGQRLIEVSGRLCYHSYAKPRPGGNRAYVGHILECGHGSVLEHCVLNLIVTGVSRSLTHELIRHRAGMGYSQRSQRYCDEAEGAFAVPPALSREVAAARLFAERWQPGHSFGEVMANVTLAGLPLTKAEEVGLNWLALVENTQRAYGYLSDYLTERDHIRAEGGKNYISTDCRKKAREAARSVLPNATATEIFVTGNLRALRGVCEQRAVPGADAEIRRFAVALARVLMAEVPNVVPDYRIERDADGEYLDHAYRKV